MLPFLPKIKKCRPNFKILNNLTFFKIRLKEVNYLKFKKSIKKLCLVYYIKEFYKSY